MVATAPLCEAEGVLRSYPVFDGWIEHPRSP